MAGLFVSKKAMEPHRIEVTDILDLHSIPPRDVQAAVEEYLAEARRLRFSVVRIVHGRGIGVQRDMVRAVLARTAFVMAFRDAPDRGSTAVDFRPEAPQ